MASDNWMLKAVLTAVDRMSPTLKQVGNVARSTRKYLGDVGSAASNLSGKVGLPLTALSGLLAGFSFAAIKKAVVSFTDLGEEIMKGALRAGMSNAEFQRMKYVADQAGVSVDALGSATGMLNRKIGDAAAGKNKGLAQLMARLKIDMRDANGQVRSGVDLLPELADAFKRNENPAVRARLGVALFGKQWQEIAPMLAGGSEEIQNSLERFKRLKSVLSDGDIRGAKELGDKFKDLDFVLKGFQNTIAKELVPVLGPVIEDFIQWAAANRKLIASGVKEAVQGIVVWIRQVDWGAVVQGTMNFVRGIAQLVDGVGGARNALILLAVVMNLQTIAAFFGLTGAIGRMVWALGAMTVSAIPAAMASISALGTSMVTAGTAANVLLGLLGKIALVAGAGFIGWEIGKKLNELALNPLAEKLTGAKDASLGTVAADAADWFFGSPADSMSAPVTGGAKGRVDGKVDINIAGLPPGSRVEQVSGAGDMPLNLNAGYSSAATGLGM